MAGATLIAAEPDPLERCNFEENGRRLCYSPYSF
jgi:hypothetical protein